VGALWVEDCACPDFESPPLWVWVASCEVELAFPVWAVASEVLVWVTGPSLPGLSTRTTTLTFFGATWVDVAVALPVCVVGALWLEACDCPEPAAACP
jgi:hypothetical protein